MAYVLDKQGNARCTLDSAACDAFTQKNFSELISESHAKGLDYYIARVNCAAKDEARPGAAARPEYTCYDARLLCKHVFEMVIYTDGRKIRVKNFKDPVSQREIAEIGFFRLRHDSETPLRAEYTGNHVSFLESTSFRGRIFSSEDATDALSVNFQYKHKEKASATDKRSFFDTFLVLVMVIMLGLVSFVGLRFGKQQVTRQDVALSKQEALRVRK